MVTTNESSMLDDNAKRAALAFIKSSITDPFGEVGKADRFLRAVVYGEQGCGKTVLACKLAAEGKTLVFDAENSTEVLKDHPELKGKVDAVPFPGIGELTFLLPIIANEGEYSTVVIDSFSTASDMELKKILLSGEFKRAFKESYTEQDYGLLLNRWTWLFDVAMRTKINVIINAHVKEPTEKEIIIGVKRRVSGSENQTKAINSRVGNVFFMEEVAVKEGMVKAIRTRTDGKVFAKTRISGLRDYMMADDFIDAIRNWQLGKPV